MPSNFIIAITTLLLCSISSSQQWSQLNHDKQCYTQGLSFLNSTHLLQSCGMYGISYFQILLYTPPQSLTTTYKSQLFSNKYFLQGSVLFPLTNIIYILTWQQKIIFRYKYQSESNNFEELTPINWISQGWGLTHNNSHMFVSDGSNTLFVVNQNFTVLQRLDIMDINGRRLHSINELQWIQQSDGKQYIYANVYRSNNLVKINIAERKVIQSYDLRELTEIAKRSQKLRSDQVLNGVAYRPSDGSLIVTGKDWQLAFQKQLIDL